MNPRIISWARERAGLSVEDLAERMGRDPEEIRAWEGGRKVPSYPVLEDLAYKYLKVTLAVFFFPKPPDIDDPIKRFRRLPKHEIARLSFDTRHKIRLAQAYQESLAELLEGIPKEKVVARDLPPRDLDPRDFAVKVRHYFGIELDQQFSFRSSESAFKAWRHSLEDASLFTFKDSFEDRFISGFSLLDGEYPVIFVNNSNAFSRQLFTLIHELGHILYGVNGVTDFDESYIDLMANNDRDLEIRCNTFAAHFLVPEEAFAEDIRHYKTLGPESISGIADKYSVSREVILRRLLDHKVVSKEYYETKANKWNREYLGRGKRGRGGGDFYLTRLAYLGEGYTKIAFENFHRGRLSETELAYHLNINSKNLAKFQRYLR